MEFRIYNKAKCNMFDLMGHREIDQTKGLGFLLAKSGLAMKSFLSLMFPQKTIVDYLKYEWIVDCEFGLDKKKADIIIRYYDNNMLLKAIIIEAKSVAKRTTNTTASSQVVCYQASFAPIASLAANDITLVTLTTYVSFNHSMVQSVSWQDLLGRLEHCVCENTGDTLEIQLIQNYINYLHKTQGVMNYYDNEVLIIPDSKSITAVKDKECGIYECPVKKGQYNARACGHPLYVAFKAGGEFNTLYKVKDILQLDIEDQKAIDSLDASLENGVPKYPNFRKRMARYKKLVSYASGYKWVFLIDHENSIQLSYTVCVPSGARGNEYRTLKEVFNSPLIEKDGKMIVSLSPQNPVSPRKHISNKLKQYDVVNGVGRVPEGNTEIDAKAFDGQSELQSVAIPNTVKRIGEVAFRDCKGLKKLIIPSSVEEIEPSAFFCCSGLEKIDVEEGNKRYDSREQCNAIIETASNRLVLGCNTTVIPTSVMEIADSAFMDCKGLNEVVLPEGITSIEEATFFGCENLKKVVFPRTLTTIKGNAFYGCRNLVSLELPESLTRIEANAFGHCVALKEVHLSNPHAVVDPRAFVGTPLAGKFVQNEVHLRGKRAKRGRNSGWYDR